MKRLFVATVLILDAVWRGWEKLKDVRDSALGSNHNDLDDQYKLNHFQQKILSNTEYLYNKNMEKNLFDIFGQILIFPKIIEQVWQGTAIDSSKDNFGYFMSIKADDFNNSVKILIAKAWKSETPEQYKYINVLSINHYKDFQHALSEIQYAITCYSNITLLLMPNGAGMGFAQVLKNNGIGFNEIHWGGQCFTEHGTKNYVNKRSQAFIDLSRAVHANRLKIRTQHFVDEIKEQLTSLHYDFDENARFKVLTNREMMKAPNSLEIAELLAYMFLDDVDYKVACDHVFMDKNTQSLQTIKALELISLSERYQEYKENIKIFCNHAFMGKENKESLSWQTAKALELISKTGSNTQIAFAAYYYSQIAFTNKERTEFEFNDSKINPLIASILPQFVIWSLLFEENAKIYFFTQYHSEYQKVFNKNQFTILKAKMIINGFKSLADQIIIADNCIYLEGHKETHCFYVKSFQNAQALNGLDLENITIWHDSPKTHNLLEISKILNGIENLEGYAASGTCRTIFSTAPCKDHLRPSHSKWDKVTFSAEDSPYFSTRFLQSTIKKYGSRNHPDYLYFVRGIYPDGKKEELQNDVDYKVACDEQEEIPDLKNMSFIDYCKEIQGSVNLYDTETVCRELSQRGCNLSLTFSGFYYSQFTQVAENNFTFKDRGFTSKGLSILSCFAVWSLLCEDVSKIYLFTEKCAESNKFIKGFIENHKRKLKQNGYQYLADQIIIDEDRIYIDGFKDTRFIRIQSLKNKQALNGLDMENITIWCDTLAPDELKDRDSHNLNMYAGLDNVRLIIASPPCLRKNSLNYKWFEYTFNMENVDGPYSQFIKNQLKKYGSRNHPDYLYFVRGIYPNRNTEESQPE